VAGGIRKTRGAQFFQTRDGVGKNPRVERKNANQVRLAAERGNWASMVNSLFCNEARRKRGMHTLYLIQKGEERRNAGG